MTLFNTWDSEGLETWPVTLASPSAIIPFFQTPPPPPESLELNSMGTCHPHPLVIICVRVMVLSAAERRGTPVLLSASVSDNFKIFFVGYDWGPIRCGDTK